MIGMIEGGLDTGKAFVEEVKRLREAEHDDHVYDAEGEHVAGDHAVDHRHEWTRETDSSAIQRSIHFSIVE